MSLLHEIYEWSIGLKPCLSDALRRLLQNSTLTAADHDDLFALLKLQVGLADPKGRVALPLDKSHLPSTAAQGMTLRLLSLKNFKNVNRIAENQKLEFMPLGLTVVYGDNGTGKSGYSRVLKLACRARDQKATVLPNAHLPKAEQGVPEARFVVESGGKESILKWQLGTPLHIDLSALSVFDSTCARAYLDAEQDVAYLPYGLDLVENLAQVVLPELTNRLKAELSACTVDLNLFQGFAGTTKVGQMIATLSAKTDKAIVESLATLNEEEAIRRASLLATLQEADPKAKAAALRRTQERLNAIHLKITTYFDLLSDSARDKLKLLDESTQTAVATEQAAATRFRAGEVLLPGTGGPEWQALFESARRFAAVAHPDKEFPISPKEKRCLLCQQEMTDGSSRLVRFEEFIRNDTATIAKQKRADCVKATTALGTQPVAFGVDTSLIEEIRQHSETLCEKLTAFEARQETRRNWLLTAMHMHDWKGCPSIEPDPRVDITELSQSLAAQARTHDLASSEETRKAMQTEFDELDAQFRLVPLKKLLLDTVDKLRLKASLEACSEHIKSRPITEKSKELTDRAVTQALSDSLNKEFEALGIQHLKTKLTKRASGGKTYHKLVLDLPTAQKLNDILSEGELRAMAIASFLAELSMSGHTGGAIFDDPVSSLDHFRRIQVAKRLVEEANIRQVIVFTHDSVFLGELRGQAERSTLAAKFYHLEWTTADFAGYCNEGLPWHHQSFDDRIDSLEKKQRELKLEWTPNPSAAMSDRMRVAYSHFRATIERAVETVFLNGVVKRFDNYIPVKELKTVVSLTTAEFDEVYRLFLAASDVVESHDPASGRNVPVPHPDLFNADITALKVVVNGYKARKATPP